MMEFKIIRPRFNIIINKYPKNLRNLGPVKNPSKIFVKI